jgi:hypothetical protein
VPANGAKIAAPSTSSCSDYGEVIIQPHDLAVTHTFLSSRRKLLPGRLEEVELMVQLALYERAFTSVQLCGRQKFAVNVGVNPYEVSYLVRAAKWWNDESDR